VIFAAPATGGFVRKPVIDQILACVCYRAKRPFTAESSVFLVQTAAQRRLAVIWAKHLNDRVEPKGDLSFSRSIGQSGRETTFAEQAHFSIASFESDIDGLKMAPHNA
jgi:hypothetical protein